VESHISNAHVFSVLLYQSLEFKLEEKLHIKRVTIGGLFLTGYLSSSVTINKLTAVVSAAHVMGR
jgi:hypothetical protein